MNARLDMLEVALQRQAFALLLSLRPNCLNPVSGVPHVCRLNQKNMPDYLDPN